MVLQNINYQYSIRNISESKMYSENYVLWRATLFPGNEISGFVHFPLDENGRELSIVTPINNVNFPFKYSSRPLINRFVN